MAQLYLVTDDRNDHMFRYAFKREDGLITVGSVVARDKKEAFCTLMRQHPSLHARLKEEFEFPADAVTEIKRNVL